MASSGTVTLKTESVDYNGGAAYTRGAMKLTNVIGWSVSDAGDISFNLISTSDNVGGTWRICTGNAPYYIELVPQVSYNGGSSWTSLATMRHQVTEICGSGGTNTVAMSRTLINQLGTYHLTGDCTLRFLYYMTVAPAPSASYPYAFPNSSYSSQSQVPVVVEVSWTATLKYNANGGTGAPADQTASTTADTKNFTVSSTVPTRTNYRFEGWSHGGNTYHGGDTFTIAKANPTQTLTAIWTEFYRPGEHKVEGVWKTHNRSGGACERKVNGSWVEMRTIDGGVGTTDPPSRKTSGTWYNMEKTGAS